MLDTNFYILNYVPITQVLIFILSYTSILFLNYRTAIINTIAAIAYGLYAGFYNYLVLIYCALFYVLLINKKAYNKNLLPTILRFIALLLLIIAVALHMLPGFKNWLVASKIQLSPNSSIFSLYINFDKALIAALFGIACLPLKRLVVNYYNIKNFIILTILNISIITSLALAFGYVKFEPKYNEIMLLWGINNLVIVCISEEIIFRQWLIRELQRFNFSATTSLILSSLIFGLLHFNSNMPIISAINYCILAFIASLFYGRVFLQTGHVIYSVLLHFATNLFHCVFFTYPYLHVM